MMKHVWEIIKAIKNKLMGSNFIDDFAENLFGENKDDDELKKILADLTTKANKMKLEEDMSPAEFADLVRKVAKEDSTFIEPNQELMDIQDKLTIWMDEELTPKEFNDKVVEELGEPIDVSTRDVDGKELEVKTWMVGDTAFSILLEDIEQQKESLRKELEAAIDNEDYNQAAILRDEIEKLNEPYDDEDK